MSPPLISLCMIAKNEADAIAQCLQSAVNVADEIIVVDTGSSDETAQIARSLGAVVIESEWRNDFAYARNAGLQHASGKWILFLDADEELDPSTAAKIRQYAAQGGADGFFVHIYNFTGERSEGSAAINPTVRLFRNDPQHRFEGRIHEQITPSIQARNPNAVFMMTDIRINHYGYRDEVVLRKNKTERNLLLLQETLKEKPDDPFHLYNISVEWLRLGKVREALEGFRKSRMTTDPRTSYSHLLYKCEAKCHLALGQYEQGASVCAEGISKYPGYTDLYHYLGIFHLHRSDLHQAKEAFAKAVENGPPTSGYHTEEGIGSYLSAYQLGLLHEAFMENDRAAECYLLAAKSSTFMVPLYRLFHLLRVSDREADIVPLVLDTLRIEDAGRATSILDVMTATGCSEAAFRLIERIRHLMPHAEAASRTAVLALLAGDLDNARLLLRQPNGPDADDPELIRAEIMLCSIDGDPESAVRHWKRLASKHPDRDNGALACLIGDKPMAGLIPSRESLSDLRTSMMTAFACRRPAAVSRMTEIWKVALTGHEREQTAERITGTAVFVRTLAGFADRHLELLAGTSRFRELSQACRLALPFEDGSAL